MDYIHVSRLQQRGMVIIDRIVGLYTANCALVSIYETKLVVDYGNIEAVSLYIEQGSLMTRWSQQLS